MTAEEKSLGRILIEIAREGRREYDGPQKNFHPSALGKCDRAVILEHAGVKGTPMTDETALFFWIGRVIHDAVQLAISKKLPGQVWNEVAVRDEEHHVSGRADTMRLVLVDGEYEVYEYKTQRTKAFLYKLPKSEHIFQVAIYLTFHADCPVCRVAGLVDVRGDGSGGGTLCKVCGGTGKLPKLARRGRIAYIGKEDGRIEVYEINPDAELLASVKAKLLGLQAAYEKYLKDRTLPDKLPKRQITLKGIAQTYKKSGKWGKAGDPKLEDDYRVVNCSYKGTGQCCGDKPAKADG